MNERIKELEAQCWEPRKYGPAWFDSEKFAELLILECIEVVKWTPSQFSNDDCVKNIQKHFGVEE